MPNFDTEVVVTPGHVFSSNNEAGVKHPAAVLEFGDEGSTVRVKNADGNRVPVVEAKAGTATRTTVSDNAIAVELLAANANRKGAYILNTSSAVLYIGLGTVDPTASDYTEQLLQWQSWRVPDCYTGQIKGIWASDPNDGGARVTELV